MPNVKVIPQRNMLNVSQFAKVLFFRNYTIFAAYSILHNPLVSILLDNA